MIAVFVYIPALLPQGVWFKSINVRAVSASVASSGPDGTKKSADAPDKHWIIELNGYAYAPDPKQEIRIVNELIGRLKKDKHLAKFLSGVNLTNIKKEDINGHATVSFSLICK